MEQVRIICPHCQLAREIPPDKVPPRPVTATCPRCQGRFTFTPPPVAASPPTPAAAVAISLPVAPNLPSASQPSDAVPPHSDIVSSAPATAPPPPPGSDGPRPATSALPPRPRPPRRPPAPTLRSINDLLRDAWEIFQRRFATLFGIYLLFILVMALPPALAGGLGAALAGLFPSSKGVVIGLCLLLGTIGMALGLAWGWGACVVASLDESLDLREAFALAREKLLPFALVSFLVSFVVTGGFLLLLIPGIVFSVWFFFAHFVIFDDDTRGMSALLKSRAYVSGRGFDVFLRLLVVWGCSAVLGAVPLVGPLLALVAVPYVMVYQALLFRDLKQAAGEVVYASGFGDSTKWLGLAVLGYVAVPMLIIALFGAAVYRQFAPLAAIGLSGKLPNVSGSAAPGGSRQEATTADGYRVIPIPSLPAAGPPTGGTVPGGPAPAPAGLPTGSQDAARGPEHISVFIYSVNYAGSVKANGVELKELETKPDMQYNYNMGGDKLVYGRNSITIDYSPQQSSGATMKPHLHLKVSYWKGSDRRVLGDWEIQETVAGQKSFDLDIPESLKGQ